MARREGPALTAPRRKPKRRRRRGTTDPVAPEAPPSASPRAPARSRALSWLGLALLAVGGAASATLFLLYPGEHGPGQGRAVELVVDPGVSAGDLAASLASAGLIDRPTLFALWLRASGGTSAVAPGRHLLTDDASPRQLVARLERRPGGGTARVTFPEGWTRFDMAKRLQDREVCPLRDFLDATIDAALLAELGLQGDSAEGFLFPATYDLPLDSDPRDLVRKMKREFDRRWDLIARARSSSLTEVMTSANLTVRDVVTLASIVEKEAAVDEERPLVASVMLNRLRDPAFHPKRLESDPTASYGCLVAPEKAPSCATFTGKATAAIEHDPANPYSTYTHEGLPPGPIANPGARSLEATVSPASTHYFYFVAKGDGRSTFSETYEAHAAAVKGAGKR